MYNVAQWIDQYLNICQYHKNLNWKTIKAYHIDLSQFLRFLREPSREICRKAIITYIMEMRLTYKPKTIKRKIASIKAFCHYLEDEKKISENPFFKVKVNLQEPLILPKTIPLRLIEQLLSAAYTESKYGGTSYQRQCGLRNVVIMELLFATGMRVSELCGLDYSDIDLIDGIIRIFGKGSKERIIMIGNKNVLEVLNQYDKMFQNHHKKAFLVSRLGGRLSEQSVRFMLVKYAEQIGSPLHITPHMFRHSFATLLLEEDVDIRYIQRFLGHSSILTTQIYTHVAVAKQKSILMLKHPRNKMDL